MSEPAPEKEQEIGSAAWEAKRQREIREVRQKERRKAAEYEQMKEAGLLPNTPTLSKIVAAASKKRPPPQDLLKIVTILLWAMPVLSAAVIISSPPVVTCYFNPYTDQCYPSSSQCYFDRLLDDCLPRDTPLIGLLKGICGVLFFGALFGSIGLCGKYGK